MKDIKGSCNISINTNEYDENTVVNIAIPTTEVHGKNMENTSLFEVSVDGRILLNNRISEKLIFNITKDSSNEKLPDKTYEKQNTEELPYIFEKIPENLSDKEISEVIGFLNEKSLEQGQSSRIYPYKTELMNSGDIKITLVIHNGDELTLDLQWLPLKLIDANESLIIADLVNINAVVSCGKTGIFQAIIDKEKLKNNEPDLSKWNISFGM